MVNGVKAIVDAPSTVRASAGHDTTDLAPARSENEHDLPWWLVLFPAASLVMTFLMILALSALVGTPSLSKSYDSQADDQIDLPVIDDIELGKTPAFLR